MEQADWADEVHALMVKVMNRGAMPGLRPVTGLGNLPSL
jgi:hypothetical protein